MDLLSPGGVIQIVLSAHVLQYAPRSKYLNALPGNKISHLNAAIESI